MSSPLGTERSVAEGATSTLTCESTNIPVYKIKPQWESETSLYTHKKCRSKNVDHSYDVVSLLVHLIRLEIILFATTAGDQAGTEAEMMNFSVFLIKISPQIR